MLVRRLHLGTLGFISMGETNKHKTSSIGQSFVAAYTSSLRSLKSNLNKQCTELRAVFLQSRSSKSNPSRPPADNNVGFKKPCPGRAVHDLITIPKNGRNLQQSRSTAHLSNILYIDQHSNRTMKNSPRLKQLLGPISYAQNTAIGMRANQLSYSPCMALSSPTYKSTPRPNHFNACNFHMQADRFLCSLPQLAVDLWRFRLGLSPPEATAVGLCTLVSCQLCAYPD